MRQKPKDTRICIVGGGPAGLSAAYYLEQKGYTKVTVLEKNDCLGGKCHTHYYDQEAYDMGAIEVTPDFKHIIDFKNKFDLEWYTIPYIRLMDRTNGRDYPFKVLFDDINPLDALGDVLKYFMELHEHRDSLAKPGFRNLPDELTVPFATWLDNNRMNSLYNAFLMPITCFGYGYLEKIPAAYVLKFIDFWNFVTVLYKAGWETLIPEKYHLTPGWPKRFTKGLQHLMECIGSTLNDVRLNINIQQITRGETIQVRVGDAKAVQGGASDIWEFDELIIAIPQASEKLAFLELSDDEQALFDKVILNHYYTTACRVGDVSYNGFVETIVDGKICIPEDGYPAQFLRSWPDNDMCVFYSYSTTDMSIEAVQDRLRENIRNMQRPEPVIRETCKWDYFPHVGCDDLKDGFYEKLEAIQGDHRTYYTGGLLNFELVENAAAYSDFIVNKFY